MTFLPIVERELRVAARRKSTYRTRALAVLVGLIVTVVFLALESNMGSFFSVGSYLFMTLAWLCFIFVCFTGVFFTSDCVSEERREGTLGLLFLTDLRGYDVILGKLMSNSLKSFYGLLAMFPILALPLLMGGVTGAEFWRMMLVLVNGLFFSLAVGIFVSSVSRDPQKAMHATFFLLSLFIVGFPLLDESFNQSSIPLFVLNCTSPGTVFVETIKKNYQMFWITLATSHSVGWLFLGLASRLTPRLWQQNISGSKNESRLYNWRFGSAERRTKLRRQLIDINPVYWLIARQRWQGLVLRLMLITFLIFTAFWYVTNTASGSRFGLSQFFRTFVILGLQIWMASQASRFFVEGRHTGSLELLLSSPLTVPQIIQGLWLALRRLFFLPVVLVLLSQVFGAVIQLRFYQNMNSGAGFDWWNYQLINLVMGMMSFITGLISLGWVGMWMGLTTKRPNIAVAKSFVFVQVIPWFALMILQIFISVGIARMGRFNMSASTIVTTILWVSKDIGFILWARSKLYSNLREVASGGKVAKPPQAAISPTDAPPIIASPA